jgi:hypothetical protein
MQNLKGKFMAILIAAILTASMGASTSLLSSASAHSPAWNIQTFSFCSVSPNPVGVGQTVNINFWVDLPPPTASGPNGDRWTNMTVVVTQPDGTKVTLGPFVSDDTGGTHTTYIPLAAGNYTFQMIFAGQTLTGANNAAQTNPYIGDYFEPSQSSPFALTVQQTAIASAQLTPLPTNYWTRPINALNNNWYTIAGDWLGLGVPIFGNTGMYNATGDFNPYTTAPTTAHILWTKPMAFGGAIGGDLGGTETSDYYATRQYEPDFSPIILNGILYLVDFPGSSNYPSGWSATNLQTGQTIWTINTPLTSAGLCTILRCGQVLDYVSPNQYGGLAYLWSTGTPASITNSIDATSTTPGLHITGTTYNMFDATTGNYILSIVNGTSMTLTVDQSGDLIGYFANATSHTLNEWNSTQCIIVGTNGLPAWEWRPTQNAIIPFSDGIMWTQPIPTNISGVSLPGNLGISAINSGVILMTIQSTIGGTMFQDGFIIEAGFSSTDGSQLWITNRTETPETLVSTGSTWCGQAVGSGVNVEIDESTGLITAYSLTTGVLLWGPTELPNSNPFSSLGSNEVVADGSIYIWRMGGDVYSYNLISGALNWQYHTPSGGADSPYGIEPIWTLQVGTVADGLLFLPEGHEYSPPLFHGAQQLALNITNGNVVWSIDAFDVAGGPAISDGIMATVNCYDNQIYAYGQGPSKTTVTAPDIGVTTATPITITGTVIDVSAGASQQAVAANFPNGLPAVSDASMTQWMEYVYEQQSEPNNVTGVPVTLTAIDPNGNTVTLGTATSDASGFYTYTYTPPIPGDYKVIATFAGTGAYYGSYAESAFYASSPSATPAPSATPITGLATMSGLTIGIVAAAIAIIIAIAIVGLLMLRKRP